MTENEQWASHRAQKRRQAVQDKGYAVYSVSGPRPHVYTAGLCERGLPELLVVGFEPREISWLLRAGADALISGVLRAPDSAQPRRRYEHAETVGTTWITPTPSSGLSYLEHAAEHARSGGWTLRACTLVPCDSRGLAPWEGGSHYAPMQDLFPAYSAEAAWDERPGHPGVIHIPSVRECQHLAEQIVARERPCGISALA